MGFWTEIRAMSAMWNPHSNVTRRRSGGLRRCMVRIEASLVRRTSSLAGKVVSIPQRGGQKTAERQAYEKDPPFKVGQRFRAGIEGRISVLFRGRRMKRCLANGRD